MAELYDVLDAEGNVEKVLRKPEGGSLKEALESGEKLYKTNVDDPDSYSPVSDATASITIDPDEGRIVVDGPKWLTSQIVASDSFKQNYSENSTLLNLVNAYRADKDAAYEDPTTGKEVKVADTLKTFQEYATSFGNSFIKISEYKDDIKKQYGVDFSDTDAAIAQNYYNKDDYDSSGVIYVPDWAEDLADWENADSWDSENKTVSTSDFFKNVYTQSTDDGTAFDIQQEALKRIKGFSDYSNLLPADEEDEQAKQNVLSDESYKSELARTIQLYRVVTNNFPETSAGYNALMFNNGAVTQFSRDANNLGYNITKTITGVFEGLIDQTMDAVGIENESARGAVYTFNSMYNPVFIGAAILGEAHDFVISGGDMDEFVSQLKEDCDAIYKGELTERYIESRDELDAAFAEYSEMMAPLSGAYSVGEAFGHLAYQVALQVAFLNGVGGLVGSAVSSLGLMPGVTSFLSKFASAKTIANIFKVLGTATSGTVQGILETMLNNGDLVDKAISSGEMTPELWNALKENILWNIVGEVSGKAIGYGLKKNSDLANYIITNTTPGKVINMAERKAMGKLAQYKYTGLHKFFSWLNKGDIANTAGAVTEGTGRAAKKLSALEKYNTGLYRALADASKLIADTPIFKEMDDAAYQTLNDAWELVFGNRDVLKEATRETLSETAETVEKTASDVAESSTKAASDLSTAEVVAKNYEAQQKAVLLRMNLENQIDAINKGVSIKMSEINTYAGKNYEEYTNSLNETTALERTVGKGKLTFYEGGSILSKESSEYLSYKTQIVRYKNRIAEVENLISSGMSKSKAIATANMGNLKNYEASVKYLAAMEEKMAALKGTLGQNLSFSLDNLSLKLSAYNRSIDDYMISNGFYTRTQAEQITRWRESGVWGENGSEFLHTARLFSDAELQTGIKNFLTELENPTMFATKMVADDAKYLKPGNIEDSFVDPNVVLYGRLRASAAVAQGQSLGRALHAISLPTRKLEGFNLDGTSEFAAQIITKDLKKMQKEFAGIFSINGSRVLQNSIQEAFVTENVFRTGIDRVRDAGASKQATSLDRELNATQERINKMLSSSKSMQNGYVNSLNSEGLDGILAAAPDSVAVPDFSIKDLRVGTFNDWYSSMAPNAQKMIKSKIAGQGIDVSDIGARTKNNSEFIRALKTVSKADANFENVLKQEFIKSPETGSLIRETDQYKTIIRARAEAELTAAQRSILNDDLKKYAAIRKKIAMAQAKAEGAAKIDLKDYKTLGEDFTAQVASVTRKFIDQTSTALSKNGTFNDLVKRLTDAGLDEASAKEYVVLQQLSGMKKGTVSDLLLESKGAKKMSIAQNLARKSYGKAIGDANFTDLAKTIGSGIEDRIASQFNQATSDILKTVPNASELVDMDRYWGEIKDAMKQIESMGIAAGKENQLYLTDAGMRHIVQLVDADGTLRFYETTPLYAGLTNWEPNYFVQGSNKISDAMVDINSGINTIFRFGTTGIDRISYVNQWFRDTTNAVVIGGAMPLTDLGVGGAKGALTGAFQDTPVGNLVSNTSLGKKLFGNVATASITQSVIDSTFSATEAGLKAAYGEEWLAALKDSAAKGLTGEAATSAYQRAVVEYAVAKSGYEAVPGLGGIVEAQVYRTTAASSTLGETTFKEVRKEQFEESLSQGMTAAQKKQFLQRTSKMKKAFDDFFSNASRGSFRETYLRKAVFTSQYKTAIESGMSLVEAKTWATRYALDSTTDFGRSFAFGNRFIKSVPYLGAAINGQKSFFRLLELDPAGVSSRFIFGLAVPYMGLLAKSLSDPKNREVYKTIREYEKEDSMFFVYNGAKIQIPVPQELSSFLAVFRHFVEKAADVQDASWLSLIASDALGILPIDMSGFIDLDANDILADEDENPIWDRISRGVEKAASSLMPIPVKAVYMLASGRDPYTGRDIDTSYTTITEDGITVMDNTQSNVARWLSDTSKQWGWNLSASAAKKILQTLLGRSTLSVLDGVVGTLSGGIDIGAYGESLAEQYSGAVDGGSDYDEAKSNWQAAIDAAYAERNKLITDTDLQNALAILRDSEWETRNPSKYEAALQVYKTKMDEYAKFVLNIAQNMKDKYPDQYTSTRVAQIVSLLTMPTGVTFNRTDYFEDLQSDFYYESRDAGIDTFIRLGFPDTDDVTSSILGYGYYDKYGQYQYKIRTPYEIQYVQNLYYGAADQFSASIKKTLEADGLTRSEMWNGYYEAKAKGKSALKAYKSNWNTQVVKSLYPMISKYGYRTVLDSSAVRDLLEDYIFVNNPYQTKQYLYQIFGGDD